MTSIPALSALYCRSSINLDQDASDIDLAKLWFFILFEIVRDSTTNSPYSETSSARIYEGNHSSDSLLSQMQWPIFSWLYGGCCYLSPSCSPLSAIS